MPLHESYCSREWNECYINEPAALDMMSFSWNGYCHLVSQTRLFDWPEGSGFHVLPLNNLSSFCIIIDCLIVSQSGRLIWSHHWCFTKVQWLMHIALPDNLQLKVMPDAIAWSQCRKQLNEFYMLYSWNTLVMFRITLLHQSYYFYTVSSFLCA